jgi:uncharacterized membrane protein HdeD (DUF308 family)
MSTGHEVGPIGPPSPLGTRISARELLRNEFLHLRAEWCWFFCLGILLVICGTAAIVFPVVSSLATVALLGVALLIGGVAIIIATIWAGHWSGHLLQLLIGVFYIVAGILITDAPLRSTIALTAVIATIFILVGLFRIVAAFVVRFPHWEWAVLNGAITFLLGFIIYRHFPQSSLWVIGVLVGVEMIFNGWTWIILSLAIRRIPDRIA